MINVIKKLEIKYPKIFEIIRFLIIGGIATIIDLFVMSIMIYVPNKEGFGNSFINVFLDKNVASGILVMIATIMGFVSGLIINYIFSLVYVYKGENKLARTKKGFLIFTLMSLIGVLIESIGVYIGYEIFNINEWIIKVVLIFVVLIFNYFTRKKFLFNEEEKTVDESKEKINFTKEDFKTIEKFIFITLFVLYFIFSLVFVFYINSIEYQFVFGCDSPRVFSDWTDISANHYRTKVHPLYVLLVYPIVRFMMWTGANPIVAVLLFLSLIATLNTYFIYKILSKFLSGKLYILTILLTAVYAFSFTQLENLMIIESFTVGTFSLLAFWFYFINHFGKKIEGIKDIITLSLLGMLTFSMVLTNYIHFLIGLLFLCVFDKKKDIKQFFIDASKYALIVFLSMFISLILIYVQEMIFVTSENAIGYIFNMLKDVLLGTRSSEEFSYMNFNITIDNFYNILLYFFGFSFVGGNVELTNEMLTISPTFITILVMLGFLALFIYSIVYLIKNKQYIAVPFLIAYLYEIALHIIYGNNELMLYIIQSSFLLLIIIAMGLSVAKKEHVKGITIFLGALLCLSLVQSAYSVLQILLFTYRRFSLRSISFISSNFRFLAFLVLLGTIFYLVRHILLMNKSDESLILNEKQINLKSIVISFILSTAIVGACMNPFNTNVANNSQSTTNDQETIKMSNILFGMGQREKFVLESSEGKAIFYHYAIDTKEKSVLLDNLHDVSYDAENYTIFCKDNNNNEIKIYEDETGIYLKKNLSLEVLDNSQTINIPNFSAYSQEKYLKILFHEVMVNVLPNGFTPNYLTYGNFWYRDGAIMAMVLKETNNLSQLRLNVTASQIYDDARGGVKEPDNLGELLYLLSLQETKNWEVINAVLEEARRIKQDDDCIHGITDGSELYVYQTIWLKFGMDSLGLDSSEYDITGKYDDYANLCWWYRKESSNYYPYDIETIEKSLFDISRTYYPYLDIARLHYFQIKIDLPTLPTYPISFEYQDWGLKEQAECSPHGWAAAELFLYLLEYDSF